MEDFYPDLSDGVSFTLTNAALEDQGHVTLKISYQDRSVSDYVDLVITDRAPSPNITAVPNRELNKEERMELRCSVTNCSPPPTKIEWTKTTQYGGVVSVQPKEIHVSIGSFSKQKCLLPKISSGNSNRRAELDILSC